MANASSLRFVFTGTSLKSGSRQCHELRTLIYFAPLCWAKRANSSLVRSLAQSYGMILLWYYFVLVVFASYSKTRHGNCSGTARDFRSAFPSIRLAGTIRAARVVVTLNQEIVKTGA
jgi:hypothetical protein